MCLHNICPIQNLNLVAAYVHHGDSKDPNVASYRDKAEKTLHEICKNLKIPFIVSEKPNKPLKSEQDFRDFRYKQLLKIQQEVQADIISLAHNSDDILESRLLFMIRGCGLEALNSMKVLKEDLLRPFLKVSRKNLESYVQDKKLKTLEDPSNKDNSFLRNWLRNVWLSDLENKSLGSKFRLAESLDNFATSKDDNSKQISGIITEKGIKRDSLRQMSLTDQQRALAIYMRQNNIKNYGQSHIKELLKHLDRQEKDITLSLLKKNWKITSQFVACE